MIKLLRNVKLVGVSFEDAQENIKTFGSPDIRWFPLVREPENPHDSNAIRVALFGEYFMGYIPKDIAAYLASLMDAGQDFEAEFVSINKHPNYDLVGLTVDIVEVKPPLVEPYKFYEGGFQNNA